MRHHHQRPVKSLEGSGDAFPRPQAVEASPMGPAEDIELAELQQAQRARPAREASNATAAPRHGPTRHRNPMALPGVTTRDSATWDRNPRAQARGKSTAKSLLQPQEIARRLLPADKYHTLKEYAECGVPTDCGEPWPQEVIDQALEAGPHTSAATPDGATLMWEDIQYQVDAGFVKVITEAELFRNGTPTQLKISRVAVVPQENRRDRIILNLSAQVKMPGSRRQKEHIHPSVNETTEAAEDQEAVKLLGDAILSLLLFAYETDCTWEILWQKIDLSDGFWRMIVEAGMEHNFVFQMPPREGDTCRYFVVPSSLQMGWKNSPAYFCTATDITKLLMHRLLALSIDGELTTPHELEELCLSPEAAAQPQEAWIRPHDFQTITQVFVDDFMNGIAGKPHRPSLRREQLWVSRASMHSIHGIFPPPKVLNHHGGKDSISRKKVDKGDATFSSVKETLGVMMYGSPGGKRLVGISESKKDKYVARIRQALASPAHRVSLKVFQQMLGQVQHVSAIMPSMKGHFTPLNAAMCGKRKHDFVGLGLKSEVREALNDLSQLLELAYSMPSHISELVPPDLPHYYATVDAASIGFGGVFLPCTRWLIATLWRVEMPPDLKQAVIDGRLTMVDCEFVGYFISNCHLYDVLVMDGAETAGMHSHTFSDNSPTVGISERQASRAKSPTPARILRWNAIRQRYLRLGPQGVSHWPGDLNDMADFPSRSYAHGYPADADQAFLEEFSRLYPLPSQLASWRLVQPRKEICSAAFLLLRQIRDKESRLTLNGGSCGVNLPDALISILTSPTYKAPPTTWNESTCSWPLLLPCGKVTSVIDSPLVARRSRQRFENVQKSSTLGDLQTLGEDIRATTG